MIVPTWITSKVVVTDSGCWAWQGPRNSGGYGGYRRHELAHRAVYRELVGPIPAGLDLDHTCHNDDATCAGGRSCAHRLCVNPAHLEPVTRQTNLLRGRTIPAQRAAQTTCIHGHDRWRIRKDDGTRQCLECKRIAQNASNKAKRGVT